MTSAMWFRVSTPCRRSRPSPCRTEQRTEGGAAGSPFSLGRGLAARPNAFRMCPVILANRSCNDEPAGDMAELFSKDYMLFWALALALALFLPVRQLIWVLYVRRAQSRGHEVDEGEQVRLKQRAGVTSALLCFVFSLIYTLHLFGDS